MKPGSSCVRGALSLVVVSLLVAGLAWPGEARAQSDDDRARFHFQAGRSYFEQGRYEDAIREWEESYRLSDRALLLRNIAEAQERLFQFDEAIASLRRYLAEGGSEAEANRHTIESRISRLRQLADQYRDGGGGADEGGGGADEGGTDEGGAGGGADEGGEGGEGEGGTDEGGAGGGADEGGEGEGGEGEGGGPPPPGGGEVERAGWVWAWVTLGATGLFAIGAVVTGVLALNARSTLWENCDEVDGQDWTYECPPEWGATVDRGYALAVTTDVFIGVASAAAVATVLLFFFEPRPERPAAGASLTPWLSAGGGGLAAELAF